MDSWKNVSILIEFWLQILGTSITLIIQISQKNLYLIKESSMGLIIANSNAWSGRL